MTNKKENKENLGPDADSNLILLFNIADFQRII
jgi:hypothetical protein